MAAEEEELKKKMEEQEAKWAEDRKKREAQKELDTKRQKERQNKLKGAFAMDGDDDDQEDHKRALELAESQKKKSSAVASAVPEGSTGSAMSSFSISNPNSTLRTPKSMIQTLQDPNVTEDAIKLRASLADPGSMHQHAPGEVAEHFRRLSEMKRKFRRAEFGGCPDKRRSSGPSRSRSREKYNSVWIRSNERDRDRSR